TVLDRASVSGPIHDLAIERGTLFVLLAQELRAYDISEGSPELKGSISTSTFGAEGLTNSKRLFVGGGIAYVSAYPGYWTFDVSDPSTPTRLENIVDSGTTSFKQIIQNGSGLGIAALGPFPQGATHDISVFDVSNPAVTTKFITTFPTPGKAYGSSIYNGLAY